MSRDNDAVVKSAAMHDEFKADDSPAAVELDFLNNLSEDVKKSAVRKVDVSTTTPWNDKLCTIKLTLALLVARSGSCPC